MQAYRDFKPTGFDARGIGLDDRQDWIVAPVSHTRDSGPRDESNFASALDMLGGESDSVEVHRFGHWGPGWFEIILCAPGSLAADTCEEIQRKLEDYPLLDEDDHSTRDFDEACEAWNQTAMRDRIRILARHKCSIFAARREEIPQGLPYFDDFHTSN